MWPWPSESTDASLRDSPEAFSATLDGAFARDEAGWRRTLGARRQFVAVAAGEVVGTAGGYVDPSGEFPELISMWVAPDWRGRGVTTHLIEEVAIWAGLAGSGELRLWIVEGNGRAARAYAKAGFKRTGQRQPVHRDETAIQVEMARRL